MQLKQCFGEKSIIFNACIEEKRKAFCNTSVCIRRLEK